METTPKVQLIKKKGVNSTTNTVYWYPQVTIDNTKSVSTMSLTGSALDKGELVGACHKLAGLITSTLLEGDALVLDGIGTFKLKVTGNTKEDKSKLTASNAVKSVGILFQPAKELVTSVSGAQFKFVTKVSVTESEEETQEDSSDSGDNTENKLEVE